MTVCKKKKKRLWYSKFEDYQHSKLVVSFRNIMIKHYLNLLVQDEQRCLSKYIKHYSKCLKNDHWVNIQYQRTSRIWFLFAVCLFTNVNGRNTDTHTQVFHLLAHFTDTHNSQCSNQAKAGNLEVEDSDPSPSAFIYCFPTETLAGSCMGQRQLKLVL